MSKWISVEDLKFDKDQYCVVNINGMNLFIYYFYLKKDIKSYFIGFRDFPSEIIARKISKDEVNVAFKAITKTGLKHIVTTDEQVKALFDKYGTDFGYYEGDVVKPKNRTEWENLPN